MDLSRRDGDTSKLLKYFDELLISQGFETQIVDLPFENIGHCIGCQGCKGINKCIRNDSFNEIYSRILTSKCIVLGSPVYVGIPSSLLLAFIQRLQWHP
ncbi:flavodoxin family protein [Clostridiaceae bacterium M8S5]|nr:flavodoxin family protein [Clostridiaceae bacterium M8S5]